MIYFAVISLLTIGYGDVSPHSKAGKICVTILLPFGMIALTMFLGKLNDHRNEARLGSNKTLLERLLELNEAVH